MKRYCKRHRKMPLFVGANPDGTAKLSEPVSALITRYRYGLKRRKPHYIYWHDGKFYRARNCAVELQDGKPSKWTYALEPIKSATAHDVYLSQTIADGKAAPVVLQISDGIAASARGAKGTPYEGIPLIDGTESPDYIAELLDLDRPTPTETPRPYGKHFKNAA